MEENLSLVKETFAITTNKMNISGIILKFDESRYNSDPSTVNDSHPLICKDMQFINISYFRIKN
jgi:hypothetical protein